MTAMRTRFKIHFAQLMVAVSIFVGGSEIAFGADWGFIIKMERKPAHGSAVFLRTENPTPYTWCLEPNSFSSARFRIKMGNQMIGGRGIRTYASPAGDCLIIKPGEVREKRIGLRAEFTRRELRKGALCYDFFYFDHLQPQSQESRGGVGTICEGRKETTQIVD
jgi:hypothetical protein